MLARVLKRSLFAASAVVWVWACSFPDYQFTERTDPIGGSGGGGNDGGIIDAPDTRDSDSDAPMGSGGIPAHDADADGPADSDTDGAGGAGGDGSGTGDSTCERNSECDSNQCDQGLCRPAHCINGALDAASESDVDCGHECRPCGNSDACEKDTDCLSGRCMAETCAAGPRIECFCKYGDCSTTSMHPLSVWFRIDNTMGGTELPLDEIVVSYWYSPEYDVGQTTDCSGPGVIDTCHAETQVHTTDPPDSQMEYVLTTQFTAGLVAPGAKSGDVNSTVRHSDNSLFTPGNDYSRLEVPTDGSAAICSRITIQRNGQLIWGNPPD